MKISKENQPPEIEWGISVSIFREPVILKQMGLAIGVPFGIIILFLLLSSNEENRSYAIYGTSLILLLLLLTIVMLLLIYHGKYEVGFVVGASGVSCKTQEKQKKINRFLNGITVFLGLLSRNPSVAGAGMLAQSRQNVFLSWKEIRKIRYQRNHNTILLNGGFGEEYRSILHKGKLFGN